MALFPDIHGRVRICSALEGENLNGMCLIVIIMRVLAFIYVKLILRLYFVYRKYVF